jgi:hypothetical protein
MSDQELAMRQRPTGPNRHFRRMFERLARADHTRAVTVTRRRRKGRRAAKGRCRETITGEERIVWRIGSAFDAHVPQAPLESD